MTTADLQKRLEETYPEAELKVIDMNGNGSNYALHIKSPSFSGLSRVKQHQEVMAVFDNELKSGEIHALSIKTEVK